MDSIVDEFLAEPPAPDVQAQDHDLLMVSRKQIQAQINAARADERERIAGIVENWPDEIGCKATLLMGIRARSGARGA